MAPTDQPLTEKEQAAVDAIRSFYSDPAKAEQAVQDWLAKTRGGADAEKKVMVPWHSAGVGRAAGIKGRQAKIARGKEQFDDAESPFNIPRQPNGEPQVGGPPAWDPNDPTNPYYMNPEAAPPEDEVVTRDRDDLLLEPHRWSTEEYADITQQMMNVGLLDVGFSFLDVERAWGQMVDAAARRYAARPDDMLTPLDMLDIAWGNGEGSNGSEVKRDPITVVTEGLRISTNEQARGLLRGMLADKLGRKPTAVEVDDFQAALNDAQRANPTVTTTTNYLNAAGRETGETVAQEGGIDPEEFAEDWTDWRDPDSEYGKYQAASTYYNALRQAIVGPGGAGPAGGR